MTTRCWRRGCSSPSRPRTPWWPPSTEAATSSSPWPATAPTRDGGVSALESALSHREPPTAALCFNDIVAFGVCLALRRRGMQPGSDFGVIGFDDVREAVHADPPLTTIAVDSMGLGERAAQTVLKMIEAGRNIVEEHVGAVHLVIRESCGGNARPRMEKRA